MSRAVLGSVGERYGRWTVLDVALGEDGKGRYVVRCDCGTERSVSGYTIRSGRSRSCGCLQRELAAERGRTHGLTGSPEYVSWSSMKARCLNPKNDNYSRYGGRGITVCNEWRDSFEAFLAAVGPKPSPHHTLDRIDVDGNYEPGNVRWATPAEQRANQAPIALRTHCGRGHEFTPQNTITERSGHRHCRECRREYERSRVRSDR